MMQASVYGRLGGDPREITTKTGKPMAVASLAVQVDASPDGPPMWIGIVAFGRQADELARHAKGDLVSVSGRVQRNSYTDKAGEQREQLHVVADAVISARTVRPSGGKRQATGGAA